MLKKKTPSPKPKGSSRQSWGYKLLKVVLILGIWGGLVLAGILAWHAYHLPDITKLETSVRQPSIVFLTRDRQEIAVQGDMHGETITLKQIPKSLVRALMATEDRNFYSHWGVDFKGLLRAVVRNLVAGGYVQGGSTITQQLAKNLFLTPDRSINRKIKEMMLAFWLEHHFTKDQILTIYLNRVYLGNQTYGVDAAAQQYFGKLVQYINPVESAVIVGLLKAPSRFGRNPELLKKRASVVLTNMLEENYITNQQYEAYLKKLETLHLHRNPYGNNHRYFADWILSEVAKVVEVDQDLIVTTTIDLPLQNAAVQKIKEYVATYREEKNVHAGAFVGMSYDGAVRAMVGGADYNGSQFNVAVQGSRQAGSIFKMFVFLAAVEAGFPLNMMVKDTVYHNKNWIVNNFGWKEQGTVTLEQAMVHSINTSTVRVAQKVGVSFIGKIVERLGFEKPPAGDLSIALGTYQTNLLSLTKAFVILANGGKMVQPYGVLEIRSADGKILYQRETPEATVEEEKLFKEDTLRIMADLLQKTVEQGTAKNARIPGVVVRGKTGTTQKFRDAWFVGYIPNLVAGVWMGNLDDSPMNRVAGGTLPAKLWSDIIRNIVPPTEG
jgi:penicillin-binding protein 1A